MKLKNHYRQRITDISNTRASISDSKKPRRGRLDTSIKSIESRSNELAHRLSHCWVSEPIDNDEYGLPKPLSIGRKINDEDETAFRKTKPMQVDS